MTKNEALILEKLSSSIEDINTNNQMMMNQMAMMFDQQQKSYLQPQAHIPPQPKSDNLHPDIIANMSITKVLGSLALVVIIPIASVYMKLNDDMLLAKRDIEQLNSHINNEGISFSNLSKQMDEYEKQLIEKDKLDTERFNKLSQKIENTETLTSSAISAVTTKVRELDDEVKRRKR